MSKENYRVTPDSFCDSKVVHSCGEYNGLTCPMTCNFAKEQADVEMDTKRQIALNGMVNVSGLEAIPEDLSFGLEEMAR